MPPSCSTELARWICRGCGCRGSTGWIVARLDTRPMVGSRGQKSKNSAKHTDQEVLREARGGGSPEGKPASVRGPPGSSRASVFVAPATFQVPHLVQPAFLLLGFASHPFALLDQLADLLPALVTDLGVELRTACGPDRLAALLADLLVEAGAPLRLDRVAALLADLLVERPAPLRLHRLAALAADLLVEGMPVFVAHRLAALAACLRHARAGPAEWCTPARATPLCRRRARPSRAAFSPTVRPLARTPARVSCRAAPSDERKLAPRPPPRTRPTVRDRWGNGSAPSCE